MPLKLNLGLSRKVGETNYGSRGASVNIEMELESALVGEPVKLLERIRQIFDTVRSSLADELNGATPTPPTQTNGYHASTAAQPQNGRSHRPGQAAPPPTLRSKLFTRSPKVSGST